MGKTEDDLDPYVVFYTNVDTYLTDENNHFFIISFEEDFADFFKICINTVFIS